MRRQKIKIKKMIGNSLKKPVVSQKRTYIDARVSYDAVSNLIEFYSVFV